MKLIRRITKHNLALVGLIILVPMFLCAVLLPSYHPMTLWSLI